MKWHGGQEMADAFLMIILITGINIIAAINSWLSPLISHLFSRTLAVLGAATFLQLGWFRFRSRHTVVCRAAQEAGVPPVSILTGRKKMQFSHLCSSVIPYPIGTKFAREVPASKGSLHTKFEENRSSHFRDTSE